MSKCSGNLRTICGVAAAAAIIVACPVHAKDAVCRDTPGYNFPDLSTNPALALGHVTSAADRVHFVKEAAEQPGCPSRAPACTEHAYLVPGDRVIISARRGAFLCATYINAEGGARLGWLPADAVADDKAEPVALADWLGHWRHKGGADEGDIAVKAGNAGALRIEGSTTAGGNDPISVERGDIYTDAIEGDVTRPPELHRPRERLQDVDAAPRRMAGRPRGQPMRRNRRHVSRGLYAAAMTPLRSGTHSIGRRDEHPIVIDGHRNQSALSAQ
jgi:hypothetical protein